MTDTAIFDMDGLLFDTEPLWGTSMLEVAGRHRIPITAGHFRETTGLRIYEVTDYWAKQYPWEGAGSRQIADEILVSIIDASKRHATILPGVRRALELLRGAGVKTGLASSSPAHMISELVDHFGLRDYFGQISSADEVSLGKPHPAVFLHCAERLGSDPIRCVVFEDSLNGVIAGKAARMKVIAVPDELHRPDPRFALADLRLQSMEQFELELLEAM